MRLWHRDLIPYLPKQQLLGQWRELCCIGVALANDHTPNHILVNPILDYPPEHFEAYCNLVIQEMKKRKMEVHDKTLHDLQDNVRAWRLYLNEDLPFDYVDRDWSLNIGEPIYFDWHNNRYLKQCYYNLEEKYDRGGIPENEWIIIFANFGG
mgnify:CR=1 FL=1